MSDLTLNVNSTAYGGWKSINVRRSMEEISGSYSLGISELWPEQAEPREIRTGDSASVVLDKVPLVTGYVDQVEPGYDAYSHGVTVSGRDATADLVDCAAEHGKGEWRNVRLDQIARDLATPYGTTVLVQTELGAAFPSFAIEPGESVFDCLERAARQRGVLLLSDGKGGLVLGMAGSGGTVATPLVEGENIRSCSASNDASQRFKTYIVKGQRAGSDQVNGAAASALRAVATDSGVKRARTLVIIAEDEGDLASLTKRAQWEATVRAARALTVRCEVAGWTHAGGIWHPNSIVRFRSPTVRLDRDLLIREVELIADEQGKRTNLILTPQEAYSSQPVTAKKAPKRRGAKKNKDVEDFF
ncbi:phage baseplate assembly protein [Stenotrophomonas sp. PS02298]|uniref:phage baseplate assembly protein n=1 Tax=Stenotrophomonas sp. PS02298 TaxID=2991424 RepID=UPI00249BF613|nr:contractile injection system protein, VgrG/Pvc8 family [Stenotrophomonas sp. PS02298]